MTTRIPAPSTASWLIEQEAQALLTRLDRVRPFALSETMVPAAALLPAAQSAVERLLIDGRSTLHRDVEAFLGWIRGVGSGASPGEQHRRFVVIRMRFNDVLSQLDLFSEVVTQRSEAGTGVWLSGLDVLAADALGTFGPVFESPPVVCHLARGPGAAIRRAHTRLPGGASSPVAIVRIPRERMVGHGIGSSLVHEVGHQGAHLMSLVESLRPRLQQIAVEVAPPLREAWRSWDRWLSEIVADLWSVATLGISSTLGLLAVVSLPRWAVFRPSGADPHPTPYVRVLLSTVIGRSLYPHPQWDALAVVWEQLYPQAGLPAERRRELAALRATMPAFVAELVGHRPAALRGRSLAAAAPLVERRPENLLATFQRWQRRPVLVAAASPSMAFAVLGQARAAGLITPAAEARVAGNLLTYWASRSTLDTSATCAEASHARIHQHVS